MGYDLLGVVAGVEREIEDWVVDVEVYLGMSAVQFQAGLRAGQGVQGVEPVLRLGLRVQLRRQHLHQLRSALKGIQPKYAVLVGQFQPLGHLGTPRLGLVALGGLLLVDRRGFLHRVGRIFCLDGVVAFPLARGIPVHQIVGEFFPLAAALDGDVPTTSYLRTSW